MSHLTIIKPFQPARVSSVFDSYWKFATLRQDIFFNKLHNIQPWTKDPILRKFKFTNAYRASDRVSQYLIRHVIYNDSYSSDPTEILFRILIFKLFNKIETWELLKSRIGEICYDAFDIKAYDRILSDAMARGKKIYSAAYIMPSGKSYFGHARKHTNHLELIDYILKKDTAERLIHAPRMQSAFELLREFPTLGDFLAYQLVIDINYSPILNFSESDFVVAGPGAKSGISKCFIDKSGLSDVEIIKLMYDNQESEFERLGLTFKTLWGRKLQLIDCQNLFCEVDKYARVKHPEIVSDRTKIKQIYKHNPDSISLFFPPKWGINESILRNIVPSNLF